MEELDIDATINGPLLKKLDHFRKTDMFYDLQIQVGEHTFKAHRLAVAIRVPEFCTKHSSAFYSLGCGTATVTDIDRTTMSQLLDYVYTGVVTTKGNVFNLLHVAHNYDISILAQALEKFAVENFPQQKYLVTPQNCIILWHVADKFQNELMKDFLAIFIQINLNKVPLTCQMPYKIVEHIARTIENDQAFSQLYINCLDLKREVTDRLYFLKFIDFSEMTKEDLASITEHPNISVDELRYILTKVVSKQINSGITSGTTSPESEVDFKPLTDVEELMSNNDTSKTDDKEPEKKKAKVSDAAKKDEKGVVVCTGKPVLRPITNDKLLKPISSVKDISALPRRKAPCLVTFDTLSTINSTSEQVIILWSFDNNALRNEAIWRLSNPHANICGTLGCPGCDCRNLELVNSHIPQDLRNLVTIRVHKTLTGKLKATILVLYMVIRKKLEVESKSISLTYRGTKCLAGQVSVKPVQEKDLPHSVNLIYSLAVDKCDFSITYTKIN